MRCKLCLAEKEPGAFYVSNKTRCKDCVKASANAHRQANLESVRAYDRMRGSMPHRVAARTEYQSTRAYAESHTVAVKRWVAKHPERKRATSAVSNAIKCGKLTPWPVCEVPTCDRKPEAHHPHYAYPLLVTWLCPAHHAQAHALLKAA